MFINDLNSNEKTKETRIDGDRKKKKYLQLVDKCKNAVLMAMKITVFFLTKMKSRTGSQAPLHMCVCNARTKRL